VESASIVELGQERLRNYPIETMSAAMPNSGWQDPLAKGRCPRARVCTLPANGNQEMARRPSGRLARGFGDSSDSHQHDRMFRSSCETVLYWGPLQYQLSLEQLHGVCG